MIQCFATDRRGFSLIEIMVVITIIGVLIAISGGAYTQYMKYAEEAKTKEQILELENCAEDYNNRRGDYPPSRLKYLTLATTGDDANEGIEAFIQALYNKEYDGLRPDDTDELINTDEDEADKNLTVFGKASLLEFSDTWGHPLIYISHVDYDKVFPYLIDGEMGLDRIDVQALRNPKTGTYFNFESCQIMSVGPDGLFDTEDDVYNFDRLVEEEY